MTKEKMFSNMLSARKAKRSAIANMASALANAIAEYERAGYDKTIVQQHIDAATDIADHFDDAEI